MALPLYDDFPGWAKEQLQFDPSDRTLRAWIETNLRSFRNSVESHAFTAELQSYLTKNQAEATHKAINVKTPNVEMNTKSFESIVSKMYRINIIENDNFPQPPAKGWLVPDNCFRRIKDLIRTTIVCRHLDEPERIANDIRKLATAAGLPCDIYPHAKEEGYYAYHIYVKFNAALLNQSWEEFEEGVDFEIQVTTEMQYMLYALTHVFYENERHSTSEQKGEWKWNYKSSRFSASYISHSLHLLEGLILRLYEDVAHKESPSKVTK